MVILSGDRDSGKTTFCMLVAEAAQKAGWQVGGVVSPALTIEGEKRAIEAVDLRSGERRLLARPRQRWQDGIQTPHWTFDPQQMAWGDQVLAEALPCDLLIVDELGPLEFIREQGWLAGLTALDGGSYRLALVVIRPELLTNAQRRWPHARNLFIDGVEQAVSLAASFSQHFTL